MNCSEQQHGHRALIENLESRRLLSATLAVPQPLVSPLPVVPVIGNTLASSDVQGPQKLEVIKTTSQSITIEWNAVKAEGFSVERSVDGQNFVPIAKVASNVTQFTDAGLKSGSRFFYQVRAIANGNVSDASPIAQGTTLSIGIPPPAKDPGAGIPTL